MGIIVVVEINEELPSIVLFSDGVAFFVNWSSYKNSLKRRHKNYLMTHLMDAIVLDADGKVFSLSKLEEDDEIKKMSLLHLFRRLTGNSKLHCKMIKSDLTVSDLTKRLFTAYQSAENETFLALSEKGEVHFENAAAPRDFRALYTCFKTPALEDCLDCV